MKKREILVVSAAVAPVIRNNRPFDLTRAVNIVDKNGTIVGITSLAEVIEKQLVVQGIEIDTKVTPGVRPKALRCACGMPYIRSAERQDPDSLRELPQDPISVHEHAHTVAPVS